MAGAMGWSAADVAETSLWQLVAAFEGFRKANGAPADEGLTDAQFDKLSSLLDQYS